MNLPQFIKAVDLELENMSTSELKACIRELARTLPEKDRPHFLNTISKRNTDSKKKSVNSKNNLTKEIDIIMAKFIDINNGQRCLDSEYNEDWDD